ncbi:MAG: HAMP domain-containing protein [Candidatus Magnetomorum sp.]|nr:HAMP domain-containing protein [Candidatus Magnetomorum sp.]
MGILKHTFKMIMTIILIIITVFAGLTLIRQDAVIMKVVENQAQSLSVSVARVNQDAMVSSDYGFIVENTLTLIQRIPNLAYVIMTKEDRFALIHIKERWEQRSTVDPSWKMGDGTKECGDIIYSDLVKANVFHYAFPVKFSEVPWGHVYVGISLKSFYRDRQEMYLMMLCLTLLCIGFGAVLAYFFSRRLTRPILALEEVTRRIAKGDLTATVNLSTHDEIQHLAVSFNTMTEKLKVITVSKNYMNNIIQNMNDSLIVINQKFDIETINIATERLLGYSSEQLLGQPVNMILPEPMVSDFFNNLKHMANGKILFPKESNYLTKDGACIPILFSATAMRESSDHEYIAYLLLALNIKEKKETEHALKSAYLKLQQTQSQLIQSGKLASIGELAAGVAHELNQPLMVIRTAAQYMKRAQEKKKLTIDDVAELNETVEKNTRRMMNIINHLRAFSRQSMNEFTRVNVNQVVEDAFLLISEQLRLRNIQVKKNLATDIPDIYGDQHQLEQVILNLLTNSRDAILAQTDSCENCSGMITITTQSLKPEDDAVAIFVKDNGIGINETSLDKIFDPFYTTKDVGKGTGLGLSISYGIIKAHHGHIRVIHSEKNETVFSIKLPVKEESEIRDIPLK